MAGVGTARTGVVGWWRRTATRARRRVSARVLLVRDGHGGRQLEDAAQRVVYTHSRVSVCRRPVPHGEVVLL